MHPCTSCVCLTDWAGAGALQGPYFTRTNICTPSQVGGVDGRSLKSGKVPQLMYLAEQFGVSRDRILFFDGECALRASWGGLRPLVTVA
jgi:hypothetical protein